MKITKYEYVSSPPREWTDRKRTGKMVAIPNKSLPISEIVRRYTIGLSSDTPIVQTSNHPDSQIDLERLARHERVEKAYIADEMRRDNERKLDELKAEERDRREQAERDKKERLAAKKAARLKQEPPPGGSGSTGIDGA